jgi:valyl-tRNA synthetase
MASTFKFGYDASYPEKEVVTGQKLIIKLFNSTKFAIMHLKDFDIKKNVNLEKLDLYVLNKLNKTIEETDEYLEKFEFSKAISTINLFFWDLCDNYLEIIKDRLYNPDRRGVNSRESAQYTLYNTFNSILKMYSIFTPFITEELYHAYFIQYENSESIHLSNWPKIIKIDEKSNNDLVNEIYNVISTVRTYKSNNTLSLKTDIENLEIKSDNDYTGFMEDLKAVTKAKNISILKDMENPTITLENISLKIKLN